MIKHQRVIERKLNGKHVPAFAMQSDAALQTDEVALQHALVGDSSEASVPASWDGRRQSEPVDAEPLCVPAGGSVYRATKRTLDVLGALLALLLLAPLLLLVALIIKIVDGGPVVYRHTRVGLDGTEFTCFKFCTMVANADQLKRTLSQKNFHLDDRTFKIPNDPRITRFGRFLRLSSIDETLQLWNVLRGDMSLVGPRPPIPEEVARYSLSDMRRFQVKPGLTCTWQVSGRSKLPFPMQLELDLEYIERRSLWLDLKLIWLTVPAVLSARGAY